MWLLIPNLHLNRKFGLFIVNFDIPFSLCRCPALNISPKVSKYKDPCFKLRIWWIKRVKASKIYCDMPLNKMLEIYIWQLMTKVLHGCFRITIFESKTRSCLLHALEFLKIWHYLLHECKHFRQSARYLSRVYEFIALCSSIKCSNTKFTCR